jgi:DNA-directed RNA polymerase specialized sigma subunit
MISRDIVLSVREMLERHCTISDISAKLNISVEVVQQALDFINNFLL